MLDATVIYRVVYSPTTMDYAWSPDGIGVRYYHSYKRAALDAGELSVRVVTVDEFDALRVAS